MLIGLGLLIAFLILAVVGPLIAPYNPSADLAASGTPQPPSAAHWLGTTQTQQDVLSQLLAGGRSTIVVAFLAGVVATVIAVVVGVTAGYLGGLADDLLSLLANIFLVMPALLLLIVIFGFLPASSDDLLIGAIIALTGWAWGARVLRAQTLSLRNRDFVESARITGESTARIIGWEIVPNLLPIIASSFLFTVLYGVGTYTAIAYLGLVNIDPHWSWGGMLFWAQSVNAQVNGYWWWYIPPGLAVALLGTALALLNFGIDEFINPRLRSAGLTRRRARQAGIPARFPLGVTPVVRLRHTICRTSAPAPAHSAPPPPRPHGRPPAPGRWRRDDRPGCSRPGRRPLIEVRGLRVDYGLGPDAVHAVIDADLTLVSGAVLGLAGESGSGKSTLAYAMTRLLRAPGIITGGQVLLHGGTGPGPGEPAQTGAIDLLAADERQLRELRWSRIAVVMQSAMHALNPVVTIGAQLTDVLQAHRLKMDKTDRRQRAAFLLEMVGISADNLRRYPHQLSGGMRQRVMIAMALALEPAVVIMDEPTTALDVVTQREILTELAALQRDLSFAVLFITHDLSLLVELADSIAVMYAGRLLEQAAAGDLYRAPRHPYTLGLLRSFPPLHGARKPLTGIPGSPPDLRTPPPGCPFHPRCGYAMDVCRTEMPAAFRLRGPGARALTLPPGAPPARRGAGHPRPDGKAEEEPIVELSAMTTTPTGGMWGPASPAVLPPGP